MNCRLSTVSKVCIQLVYKKFTIWRSFPLPAWLSALSPAPRSCLAGTPPSPPLRVLAPQVLPVPLPAQARECKGRSPLHKKTNIPPSRREERSASAGGGMGEKRQTNGRVPENQWRREKSAGRRMGWKQGAWKQGNRRKGTAPKKTATTNQKTKKKGYQYA